MNNTPTRHAAWTFDRHDAMRHGVTMPPKPPELLTSTQAGHIIGKSARTVLRLAEAGKLPIATKLPGPNGHFLFNRRDVEALLNRAAS
jgi:hypothetical protein